MLAVLLLGLALALAPQQTQPTGPAGIAGHVVDDVNAPIEGARVFATALEGGARIELVTDRTGQFRFSNIPSGRYRVQAEKQGYVVSLANAGIATTVDRPMAGFVLTLYKAGLISGVVTDERGNPIPGAMVHALRKVSATGSSGSQGPGPRTDDRGEYRVSVMAGDYTVLIEPPGRPPGTSRNVALMPTYYPATTDANNALTVTVRPGEQQFGFNVIVQSGPAFTISGIVVDDQGRPQAGTLVTVIKQVLPGQLSVQVSTVGVTTLKDGSFTIAGVPPGRYQLSAMPNPTGSSERDLPTRTIAGAIASLNGKVPLTIVDVRDADLKDVRVVLPPSTAPPQ